MVDSNVFRIAILGDIVARPGREVVAALIPRIKEKYEIDFVIANGENASGGMGIDARSANEIRNSGVDIITLGDHAFHRKGSREFLATAGEWCVRPVNLPPGTVGSGTCVVTAENGRVSIGICNILGRVFMGLGVECPFRAYDGLEKGLFAGTAIRIVDFHAEATSEKLAFARYVDGRASVVVGTHTHVQTADERLLPGGTAFISDLGMCGSQAGVIGMRADLAVTRLKDSMPASYEAAEGSEMVCGVVVDFDRTTWKCRSIQRLQETPEAGKAS